MHQTDRTRISCGILQGCTESGDEIVSRLIDKRLVIRSGTRLTIYWDIFRDYILTEKIPYIPVTYVPQANFNRYANALAFMVDKTELTYAELGAHMHLSTWCPPITWQETWQMLGT